VRIPVEMCGHHDRIYWKLHILAGTSQRSSAAFVSNESEDNTESVFNADCCNEIVIALL
jgi:hypothetical protein